jgi:hypothetical protein
MRFIAGQESFVVASNVPKEVSRESVNRPLGALGLEAETVLQIAGSSSLTQPAVRRKSH